MTARWRQLELPDHPQRAGAPSLDARTMVVFVSATVLLVLFEYWGVAGQVRGTGLHTGLADRLGDGYEPYFDLIPYQWWGVASLLIRVLAPLAVVVWVLRERPRDWGFRLRGQWAHVRPYLLFYLVMVPILVVVSATSSFQATYPFYAQAGLGGWHFWGFELFYFLQFLGVEAFFRGFLLFGLERKLGWYAVPVMVIPYVMIHFGKPMPETFAAIIAGFALGFLALRSRSFLWGVLLHFAVAITMDVFALGRELGGVGNVLDVMF